MHKYPRGGDNADTPKAVSQPTDQTQSFDGTTNRREGDSVSQEEPARTKYGRYTVQKMLGVGGFGRVYLAEDDQLKRLVALKIPRMSGRTLPKVLELHRAEAQTVAALDVPGVVPIYDIGMEEDGSVYIVSKYIQGSDLHTLMERKHLDRETAVRICKSVAETLHAVHRHSVVHRDIKPGNILVDEEGRAFVGDFGLALRPSDYGKGGGKTGTLRYMSPEQVRGESHLVDGRSDLFSLGIILYEMLTVNRPFDGPDMATIHHCIQFVEPKPLRQIDDAIPVELERICLKALAKKASDRYATGQDLADDLDYWLGEKQRIVDQPVSKELVRSTVNVVPRGLRAFRGRDSAFFLDLLPGPRDREGLPDLVRHWKMWIQEKSTDDACRIGVMYGPSGCGKSSMLQAGILPLLGNEVDAVTIQASSDPIEKQLKRALLRRSSPVDPSEQKLEDMSAAGLIAYRREHFAPQDKTLLLVIDQFEHWLLNLSVSDLDDLAMTFRQCDGVSTKVLLLVRDDFWVALGRFMSVVDVPLIPDSNCSLVDLFDPAHAQKVLESFGRAYGRLPDETLIKPEHQRFVAHAVEDLTRDGKVYPVQLALFAEMLKGRPWVPDTLDRLGGVEGIGTRFLEEAFEAEHAPVKQRMHQQAARFVLESLIPEAGSVRTRWRTREELIAVSGYENNPTAFNDLLQILDTELRLISPIDRLDNVSGSIVSRSDLSDSSAASDASSYQLSHDFLIPSLRDWVSRKQLETYRGRVKLQMTEMASLWSAKQGSRFLPSWSEWLKFRLLIPGKSLSEGQREMMRFASRRHLTSTAIVSILVLVVVVVFRSWQDNQRTRSLVRQLSSARFAEVPEIAMQLTDVRGPAEPRVRQQAGNPALLPDRRLAAELVLLRWDSSYLQRVIKSSLEMTPDHVAVVGDYLKDVLADSSADSDNATAIQPNSIYEGLWEVLENENESERRRLASGLLLLQLGQFTATENQSRQETTSGPLARMLVNYAAFHPSQFRVLAEVTQVAAPQLAPPMSVTIGQDEPSLESSTSINFLLAFFRDDPQRLADLVLDASPWQYSILLPEVTRYPDLVVPFLRQVVQPHLATPNQPASGVSDRDAIRVATAAALLARLSDSEPGIWNFLSFDPTPTVRCTLIHRFVEVDVPVERLMRRLVDEQNEEISAALMQALGQYPAPTNSDLGRFAIDRVLQAAVGARSPAAMSSANWLVRRWDVTDKLETRLKSPPGGAPASPHWRDNSVGLVMVKVDALAQADIGRVFEIATTEISVAQYQQFDSSSYYAQHVSPTKDCPINVVSWYEAIKFCRWLSEKELIDEDQMCYPPLEEIGPDFSPDPDHIQRSGYRLPTVAEWTYACRAGTTTPRYFGGNPRLIKSYAVYGNTDLTMPCGSLKPNDFGLFDTLGNVMEWTADSERENRLLCGGSYVLRGDEVLATATATALPATEFNSIGFRVVRTIVTSESGSKAAGSQ